MTDEQVTSVHRAWQRSERDVIDHAADKINGIFSGVQSSEMPSVKCDFVEVDNAEINTDRYSTILLLVSDDAAISGVFAKLLAKAGIRVRRIPTSDFLTFDLDERSLQAIERDIWWGHARHIITLVSSDKSIEGDVLKKRGDWLNFVENLHRHSPILRSRGGRGDVKQGLAFLDWNGMSVMSEECLLDETSPAQNQTWKYLRDACRSVMGFLGAQSVAGVNGTVVAASPNADMPVSERL